MAIKVGNLINASIQYNSEEEQERRLQSYQESGAVLSSWNQEYASDEERKKYLQAVRDFDADTRYLQSKGYLDNDSARNNRAYMEYTVRNLNHPKYNTYDEYAQATRNPEYITNLQTQLNDLQSQLRTVQDSRSSARTLGDLYMQQNAENDIQSQIRDTKNKLANVAPEEDPEYAYYKGRTLEQLMEDKKVLEGFVKQDEEEFEQNGIFGKKSGKQSTLRMVNNLIAEKEREARYEEYAEMFNAEDFDGEYDPNTSEYDVIYQAVNEKFGDNSLGERIYSVENNFDEMTDAERQLYNYIHKTQGKAQAEEFFRFLQSDLNLRDRIEKEAIAKSFAEAHPGQASVVSTFFKITSPLAAMHQIANAFSDIELTNNGETVWKHEGGIDQNAPYNYSAYISSAIRNQVSEDITRDNGETAAYIYNMGMSVADNVAQMMTTGGSEPFILALMGSSVFADRVVQGKDQGMTDGEIISDATIRAAIEVATEKVGLDNALSVIRGSGFGTLAKAVFAEGMEEGVSNIANLFYDCIDASMKGDPTEIQKEIERLRELGFTDSEALSRVIGDKAKDLGLDVLAGALSGFTLSGMSYAGSYVGDSAKAKAQEYTDVSLETSIEQGLSLSSDSKAYKNAQILSNSTIKNKVAQELAKINQINLNNAEQTREFKTTVQSARATFEATSSEDFTRAFNTLYDAAKSETEQMAIAVAAAETHLQIVTDEIRATNPTIDTAKVSDVVQILRLSDATARTSNGEIVRLSDIQYNNANDRLLYSNAIKNIRKTSDANDYIAQYKALSEGRTLPVASYDTLFKTAYEMGMRDATLEEVLQNSKVRNVIDAFQDKDFIQTIQIALSDGANAVMRVTEGEQAKVVNLGKTFGYDVQFVDGLKDANGRNIQGKFEKSTKTIYISTTTTNPATMVFCHEVTHAMELDHPKAYEYYKNRVLDRLKQNEASYENRRNEIADLYGWDRNTTDAQQKAKIESDIDSELVAIASENFLIDEAFVNELKDNKALFRQLRNSVINKYRQGAGDDFRASLISDSMADEHFFEELGRIWINAVQGNEITETDVETIKEEAGIETEGELDTDFTENQYAVAAPYRGKALQEWVDSLPEKARETYELFSKVKSIGRRFAGRNWTTKFMLASEWNEKVAEDSNFARVAKDIANAIPIEARKSWMNDDGTIKESSFEKDYKMQRSIMQRLLDRLPMTTVEPYVNVDGREIRVSDKDKIYCIGGEEYRQALYNARLELYNEGKLPTRKLKGLRKDTWGTLGFIATNTKTGASGDFTTFCPQMYYNNGCKYCYRVAALASGVNNKLVGENVWYTGELLQISKADIDDLNRMGGLRIQSFGDWMDRFSPQLAQVLADAERVGLQVKIITKEPSMIGAVAMLKEAGLGKNLYFNLSSDYVIERAGSIETEKEGGAAAMNPMRPYMRDAEGEMWWKRALTVEEANEYRQKYPWVNTRIVATTVEEFIRGLKSPIVDVVTGYHGNMREFERIDSETGETIVQTEAIGDAGMPRFRFDYKTQAWETEYEGKTKTHKLLAQRIIEEGLQYEYFIKSCCITGRCATCVTKCGLRARAFNMMNATNRDNESVVYWKDHMVNPKEFLEEEDSYSREFDSNGNELTQEQIRYFEESLARDELGNLLVFYHGTSTPTFTIFDPQFSDDKRSLFFTDNPKVANTYTDVDKGRNVDTHNLPNSYDTAEKFNQGQEKIGGRIRVAKITPEFIDEYREKYSSYIDEVSSKETKIDGWNWSYSGSLAKDLERDTKNLQRNMGGYVDYIIHDGGSLSNGETIDRSYWNVGIDDRYVATEAEAIKEAVAWASRLDDSTFGNRYAVYLNLKNPLIIDTGTYISGKYDIDVVGDSQHIGLDISFRNGPNAVASKKYDESLTDFLNRVFSPKFASTMERRLGSAYERFDEIEKTYKNADVDYIHPSYWQNIEYNGETVSTRELAKIAMNAGFDGVILKNLSDIGGYSGGTVDIPSTVAIAFNSNQIKSVDNANPTEDPDINYAREFENTEETDELDQEVAKALKGIDVSKVKLEDSQIKKIADRVLRGLNSEYSTDDLAKNLKGAFQYWIDNKNVNYDALKQVMSEIMLPVVNSIYTYDKYATTNLSNKTFIISDDVAKEFGGVNNLRKRLFTFGVSFTTNPEFQSTSPNRQVMRLTDSWNATDEQKVPNGVASEIGADTSITSETEMVQAMLDYFGSRRSNARHQAVPEDFAETYADNLALRAFIEFLEESRVSMADVSERTRANVRRETARVLEEVRNQYEQRYLDMMAEGEEAIRQKKNKLEERSKKAHYFDMLKKEMKRLERLVKHPTRNKHIDVEYVKYLGKIADMVDITSNRRVSRANDTLRELAEEYKRLATEDLYRDLQFDSTIYDYIQRTADMVGNRPIRDLSSSEIKEVFNCVRAFIHAATMHNNFIDLDEARDVNDAAIRTIADVDSAVGIGEGRLEGAYDWWASKSLNPLREIDRIVDYHDDDPLHLLMNKLVKGEIKVNQYKMEMAQIFAEMDRRQFDKGTPEYERAKEYRARFDNLNKNLVEVTLGGATQLITEGQKLALIMHDRGGDNMTHILNGGVLIPNLKYYERGDLKNAYIRGEIVIPTQDEINEIKNDLDDFEKWFLDRSIYYFETYSKNLINSTSLRLEGFARAEVENYYPIRVAENYTRARSYDIATGMETSGENLHSGMLMARVRSTLPIYLNSITQDLQRSQNFVSRYAGLSIPLRDFNRMYFIKVDDGTTNGKPLKDVISKKWGKNATEYIDRMLKDLTNGRDVETNTILDKIRSKSAQSVLTLNPSVSIKQSSSYVTAISELDYKSVMRALVNPEGSSFILKRADQELIQKYTPLLWSRMAGMSTQEIAELSMMQNKNFIDKGIEKLPFLTDWIRKVDVATVGRLWYATQYWVDDHYKNVEKGSDQYYRLVADKFEDVVTKTQPNYTVLTRPDILRTKNSLVKALMMFKTQPLQNFGILYDSTARLNAKRRQYLEAKGTPREAAAMAEYRDAGAKFGRAVTSQLLQAAVFTGMTFLANALVLHRWDKYKDDDLNEVTFASVMEQMMWDYADSLFGSTFMIDWAEDLGAYFIRKFALDEDVQYYGISVFGIDDINNVSDVVTKMAGAIKDGDSEKALKYSKNFAESMAQLAGIPAENVEKLVRSIWEYSLDFSQGRKITDLSGSVAGNYWNRIKNAYEEGKDVDGLFDEMTDAVQDQIISKESLRHYITADDTSGIMDWVSDMFVNGTTREKQMVDDWLNDIYSSSTSIREKKAQFYEFQGEDVPIEYMSKAEKEAAGIDVEALEKQSTYDKLSPVTDEAFNDFLSGKQVSLPYKKGDDGVSDQLARLYQTSGNPEGVKAFAVQVLGYSADSINWTANRYWASKDLSVFE